nr:uncharacterized protein LOC100177763 isoform X2 [Ciona intestinalis]|eukprot:XP_002120782.3 uncharacterized protein LOC100177763 isoform X2 [Ciona intestinalis]
MTKSVSSTNACSGHEIKKQVSFGRSRSTPQVIRNHSSTIQSWKKGSSVPTLRSSVITEKQDNKICKTTAEVTTPVPIKTQSFLSSEKLVVDAVTTVLDDFIKESLTRQEDKLEIDSNHQTNNPALPEAGNIATNAVISALDDIVGETWTGSEDSSDKSLNATSTRPASGMKLHGGKRQKQAINEVSSRHSVKPWYSSSTFDKNAAEFLVNCSSSSSRSSLGTSNKPKRVTSARSRSRTFGRGSTGEIRRPASLKPTTVQYKKEPTNTKSLVVQGSTLEKPKLEIEDNKVADEVAGTTDVPIQSEDDTTKAERGSSVPSSISEVIEPMVRPARVFKFDEKFSGSKTETTVIKPTSAKKVRERKSSPTKKTKLDFHMDSGKGIWKTVLNETQLNAFRRLFSRFDRTKNGAISAAELFQATLELLPDTGSELSLNEVSQILKEFDIKGTGEIEFDEFLFAMINPKNYLKIMSDDDRENLAKEVKIFEEITNARNKTLGSKSSKKSSPDDSLTDLRRNLFFTMLKTATKKDSMKEIRHFYVNRIKKLNDHVIHDWSAGQRCIGLSYQEMIKRYEHITKELKDKKSPFAGKKEYMDSPYAQPLRWGCNGLLKQDEPKRVKGARDSYRKSSTYSYEGRARSARPASARKTDGNTGIPVSVSEANQRNDVQIQSKVDSARAAHRVKIRDHRIVDELQRTYSTPASKLEKVPVEKRRAVSAKKRTAPLRRPRISEFVCTPKVVPLPRYPLQSYPQTFNYDDLPEIRQKAAVIHEDYYNELRKVAATNSRTIYKQLQVEQMRPTMRNHFKKSYLAYSGDYEPFVVSPWIPFPAPSPWIPYPPLGQSQPKTAWS